MEGGCGVAKAQVLKAKETSLLAAVHVCYYIPIYKKYTRHSLPVMFKQFGMVLLAKLALIYWQQA